MVVAKKKPAKKKAVKTDWLGRPIRRASKAEGSKGAHPPRARRSTTAGASTRARKKAGR